MYEHSIVYIVDDDSSIRKSLERLLCSSGLNVRVCASAQEFLSAYLPEFPGCLVLDINMPDINGLELQEKLPTLDRSIPIIFVTGYADVPASVKAMKAGAIDFLEKPYNEEDLLKAIDRALTRDLLYRQEKNELRAIRECLQTLTPREKEVFYLVASGMLNKQIAYQLGIAEKTIKVHRARIMQKMKANSLADLVRFAEKIK